MHGTVRGLAIVFAGLSCLVGYQATAGAVDLSAPGASAVFAPAPAFSWSGLYAGVQVGYGFGRDQTSFTEVTTLTQPVFPAGNGGKGATAPQSPGTATLAALIPTFVSVTNTNVERQGFNADGVIGGGHVGYNVVLGPIGGSNSELFGLPVAVGVVGLEGDVDGSSLRRTSRGMVSGPGYTGYIISPALSAISSDIQGSIRGRIGFALDRVLLYATGGAAFASFSSSFDLPGVAGPFTHARVGYTVGGGVDYAVTRTIALRLEYRYSDFGTFSDPINSFGIVGSSITHHETLQQVQAGVSYFFTAPTAMPVVARY